MQDSRSSVRRAFGVEQQIARVKRGELPAPDAFQPVRLADISPDGFAFYQAKRPDFDEVIVALGLAPDLVYVTASVVHMELIEICDQFAFRVGCRFTGRLQLCDDAQTFVREAENAPGVSCAVDSTATPAPASAATP